MLIQASSFLFFKYLNFDFYTLKVPFVLADIFVPAWNVLEWKNKDFKVFSRDLIS